MSMGLVQFYYEGYNRSYRVHSLYTTYFSCYKQVGNYNKGLGASKVYSNAGYTLNTRTALKPLA